MLEYKEIIIDISLTPETILKDFLGNIINIPNNTTTTTQANVK